MARSKAPAKSASRPQASASAGVRRTAVAAPATVSGRWILTALAISIPGAALSMWLAFCFLFWQGSWQLLYHPVAAITRTPASAGLKYDPVGFAATDSGVPQLQGWWIPAEGTAKCTVLYLHDQAGNLSDTVDDLAGAHAAGVNVFAFDYQGYGQSRFVHPSEAHWRADAASALAYLLGTRHVDPRTMVVEGRGLGADLALEVTATHPELAGVVLESPLDAPADIIFNDGRARLVPARLLVGDRWHLAEAARALRIPSLWFVRNEDVQLAQAFDRVTARKTRVWLPAGSGAQKDFEQALSGWLGDLETH